MELEGGSLVGPVNQKVSGGLKIIEDDNREKYPVPASDKNVITFSDEEGKAFYSFNVSYDGMTPGVLEMTLPSSNKYDWLYLWTERLLLRAQVEWQVPEAVLRLLRICAFYC